MTFKVFYRLCGVGLCLVAAITAFCGLYAEATYTMLAAIYCQLSGAE